MTRNCNATNSVLLAAVGAIENELEVVGRHYSMKLQPRALVSCRFPFVALSSSKNTLPTDCGDVSGLLGRLPAAVREQSEIWLPVLQELGNCVDVVSSNGSAPYRSDRHNAARLRSVCLDPLSWMGSFAAPSQSASRNSSQASGDDSRGDGMRSHLSDGSYLLLRVARGSSLEEGGLASGSMVAENQADTVIDMLQELRGSRKAARRIEDYTGETVPGNIDAPVARSMQALDASAFVHDIRKVLMLISGNLDLHRQRGNQVSDTALSAAQKGVAIARDYLRAMHRARVTDSATSSSDIVTEVAQLMQGLLGDDIYLELFLDESRELAEVDAGGLKRSLLNLLLNAKEALPNGGHITLSTHNGPGYVEFRVADNGTGIPDAVAAEVFDPSFRARGFEHGSGLGLYSVRAFVAAANGSLGIEKKGLGTSVCITLPQHLGDHL